MRTIERDDILMVLDREYEDDVSDEDKDALIDEVYRRMDPGSMEYCDWKDWEAIWGTIRDAWDHLGFDERYGRDDE